MTREEAIICLKGIKNYGRDTFTSNGQSDWQGCLDMAIKALEQEPKTGHWIDHHSPEAKKCMQYMSECSACGKMICNRYNIYRNFCPNCGAKMEEEQKTT